MKMQKRRFRIGELADQLQVERFVIRFWEKEFAVKTTRSDGGQRFYSQEDLDNFKLIKELLYNQGFTIAGAKKQLELEIKSNAAPILASHKTTLHEPITQHDKSAKETPEYFEKKIIELQKQLMRLRELL